MALWALRNKISISLVAKAWSSLVNSYRYAGQIIPPKAVFCANFFLILELDSIDPPFTGLIFHGAFYALRLSFEKISKKFKKFSKISKN